MKTNRHYFKLCLMLAFLMLATALPAQKRKTTKRKKARTTAIKTTQTADVIPLDSIIGKAYSGKVGQTVVSFFGSRTTYGDVTQQIYVWHDNTAVIYQCGGDMEQYLILPYSLDGSSLTIGDYKYTTQQKGHALQLQKFTEENKEVRQGTLNEVSPVMMAQMLYLRGKYLDGMTIQTDEDKKNALICLTIAAENGQKEAKDYLYNYYKKRAAKGETAAIKYMLEYELNVPNYAEAHKYCDMMIEKEPDNVSWLQQKHDIFIKEGKASDAKKMMKKIKKMEKTRN